MRAELLVITRAGTTKILLILDYKSVISIMQNNILFIHVTAKVMYNMEVTESLFDHQMGGVSCINWQ